MLEYQLQVHRIEIISVGTRDYLYVILYTETA